MSNKINETPFTDATPQLSIRHLMLWMTCAGVLFAGHDAIDLFRYYPEETRGTMRFWRTLYVIPESAAAAGLVVLFSRTIRGVAPLMLHPGYWLVLVHGLIAILGPMATGDLGTIAVSSIASAIYIVALCISRFPTRWTVYFIAATVQWSCNSLSQLAIHEIAHENSGENSWHSFVELLSIERLIGIIWLHQYAITAGCFLLLTAVALDWRAKTSRDWFHTVGVIVVISGSIGVSISTIRFKLDAFGGWFFERWPS
ncbi:hypothetical protein FHS27_002027 [Rhodopirellula rubra]|uniref:Uncharacterized protein n=1 Tax=Aporhodopirellula rubra TaxID=980271 RepID=A0A7W5DX83_9BACT|nr:hypothetical protein [Aporhodopirellula rubra]MBB3206219.1 hypothetical protein [Aporhodopirellula rubra]